MKRLHLTLASALLATGCSSAPPVLHPDIGIDVPAQWTAIDRVGAVTGEALDRAWWRDFADPTLDAIVSEALAHNHDLQAAAARLAAAEAQARIARADRLPTADGTLSATRAKRNFIGFPSFGGGDSGAATTDTGVVSTRSTQYGVSLDLSWEIDLWGRIRAGHSAALADAQMAAAELEAARLSIAAQTAKAWLAVVEANQQLALARATVESFRSSSEYVRARYERGVRPALDLRLALTDLAGAEALVKRREEELDRARRQLEILLGRYPSGELAAGASLPSLPTAVPAGLPATLVSRRPDVVAAERRLAAADRRLAEAEASLYPRIALTGSGGTSSEDLENLVDLDFSVWTLAANLAQPIFQGGRLLAAIDGAEAREDESLAEYAVTLLAAYAEVESELAAQATLQERERHLASAAKQSAAAKALAEQRYRAGVEDYVTVLAAQRSALDAESAYIAIRRTRLASRIDLHVALGGGFDGSSIRGGERGAPVARRDEPGESTASPSATKPSGA